MHLRGIINVRLSVQRISLMIVINTNAILYRKPYQRKVSTFAAVVAKVRAITIPN